MSSYCLEKKVRKKSIFLKNTEKYKSKSYKN